MVQVTQEVQQQLASNGAALGVVWGGPQKTLYYTPSGREVWSVPSMRDWVRKNQGGKVVAQGTRDANLDKGWTLSPPADPKVDCPGCSQWHDTDEDMAECVESKRVQAALWEIKARKMMGQGGEVDSDTPARLDKLEDGLDEIKSLLAQLVERR